MHSLELDFLILSISFSPLIKTHPLMKKLSYYNVIDAILVKMPAHLLVGEYVYEVEKRK